MDKTKKVAYTCPACGHSGSVTLDDLRRQTVTCSVCAARHSAADIRQKVAHELSELEKAYIEYAENVEL